MKKALSFMLVAVMLLTALPLSASAETAAITMTPAITDAVYDYLDEIYIEKYPELGLDFSFGSDAVKGDTLLGSGMTVSLPDGTEYTVVVKGDLDSDGEISAGDARLTLRASVGLEQNSARWFTEAGNVEADENGKNLTASDARLILRASVGLENQEDWFNSIA